MNADLAFTEADRERVARQIMGWHAKEVPWAYDGITVLWHDSEGTPLCTVHSWRADEDDGQCMQVVDRMLTLGYRLSLTCDGDGCRAGFSSSSHPGSDFRHADRRVAVLRAALATVTGT